MFFDIRGVSGEASHPQAVHVLHYPNAVNSPSCGPGHCWDLKMQELISGGYPADVAADTDP